MKAVFCDWGTTNVRAYLVEDGCVVKTTSSDNGLVKAKKIGFQVILDGLLGHLDADSGLPVFLSGMIGSKHGWKESPYKDTPLTCEAMADNYVFVSESVRIFGGVCHNLPSGKRDVMRGEEIQIFGVLAAYPEAQKICLPGTHSKWVDCDNGVIHGFSTWMTGDLFSSLTKETVFKLQLGANTFSESAFLDGVKAAADAGPLLNSLFYLRTDYLFGAVDSASFHSYLSGYLIGTEIRDAADGCKHVYLCGSETMMDYYESALAFYGISSARMSAADATVKGMIRVLGTKNE